MWGLKGVFLDNFLSPFSFSPTLNHKTQVLRKLHSPQVSLFRHKNLAGRPNPTKKTQALQEIICTQSFAVIAKQEGDSNEINCVSACKQAYQPIRVRSTRRHPKPIRKTCKVRTAVQKE
jgi:hypothetical protein